MKNTTLKKGAIIVVDGPEATFKTTLCKRLAQYYDGRYYHSPKGDTSASQSLYELMKSIDGEPKAKNLLALATHIVNINRMEQLKQEGNLVICDRSILSFIVYQEVDPYELEQINKWMKLPYQEPDAAIILSANKNVILDRLEKRGMDKLDKYFVNNIDSILSRYDIYGDEVFPQNIKVDTSYLSSEWLTNIVIEKLDKIL